MPGRPREQLAQGRERTGGDDIRFDRLHCFDPADANDGRPFETHPPGSLCEKGCFAGIGFDQRDPQMRYQGGNHQARKPTATTEIDQRFSRPGY